MKLSDENFFHWRELIEVRKKQLLITEKTLQRRAFSELSADGTGEISKTRLHPADMATVIQDIEVLGTISEKNIRAIQDLEDALERLDSGTYGKCLSCKDPIPLRRLEAIPQARYCLGCEMQLENPEEEMIFTEIAEFSKNARASVTKVQGTLQITHNNVRL